MAKIKNVVFEGIIFDDGSIIADRHDPDCCEQNYADYEQLDDLAKETDFDTKNMIFESVPEKGFRFGNAGKMFFVPCYSDQNGYYSSDVDIYYNGSAVLNVECELRLY